MPRKPKIRAGALRRGGRLILSWIAGLDWRGFARRGAWALGWLARAAAVLVILGVKFAVRIGRRALRRSATGALRYLRWSRRRPRAALATTSAGLLAAGLGLYGIQQLQAEFTRSASLDCLALNIYHEARGEPETGKIAVAQVVMNRVADRRFPNDICAVVKQRGKLSPERCHFSWWCDGRSDKPREPSAWAHSRLLAEKILDGAMEDPTGGALWYHADYVQPGWREGKIQGAKIGQHIFYARP
jgi:hypothetical protein